MISGSSPRSGRGPTDSSAPPEGARSGCAASRRPRCPATP
ncbi:MAG: hypothetical protein ACTH6N_11695, partial [Brachybacterium tyrofermentans]